jgi:hypothetical protein
MVDVFDRCTLQKVDSSFKTFSGSGEKCRVWLMFSIGAYFGRCPQVSKLFSKEVAKVFTYSVFLLEYG